MTPRVRRSAPPRPEPARGIPQPPNGPVRLATGRLDGKAVPSEHMEQVAVMRWADLMTGRYPELALLYAIPNGARTSIGTARKLKAEGLKSGVPDLCLPVWRAIDHTSVWHGLYVELKRQRGGTVSPEQRAWHEALRGQGYRVEICKGAVAAIATITAYLEGRT